MCCFSWSFGSWGELRIGCSLKVEHAHFDEENGRANANLEWTAIPRNGNTLARGARASRGHNRNILLLVATLISCRERVAQDVQDVEVGVEQLVGFNSVDIRDRPPLVR